MTAFNKPSFKIYQSHFCLALMPAILQMNGALLFALGKLQRKLNSTIARQTNF